jgi:hypothetical protein
VPLCWLRWQSRWMKLQSSPKGSAMATEWEFPRSYLDDLLDAEAKAWEAERRARSPSQADKKAFRSSIGWRRVRFAALAANAARNGGTAKCELCGATAQSSGAPLHADHVEAVSRNWSRRLDPTNIQIMCCDCNTGKLDGPAADFRPYK